MTEKTKKPEKLFVWVDVYRNFAAEAEKKDILISDLLEKAITNFELPEEIPRKARTFNMTEETKLKLQAIADKLFKGSQKDIPGNRHDAVHYIMEQFLKNNEKE
jgi:hypothetical protein